MPLLKLIPDKVEITTDNDDVCRKSNFYIQSIGKPGKLVLKQVLKDYKVLK